MPPLLAYSAPATIRRIVDLPVPLAPTRATCSRSATWKVTPSKIVSLPNVLLRSLTDRIVVGGIGHTNRRDGDAEMGGRRGGQNRTWPGVISTGVGLATPRVRPVSRCVP